MLLSTLDAHLISTIGYAAVPSFAHLSSVITRRSPANTRTDRVTRLRMLVVFDQREMQTRLSRQRVPNLINTLRRPFCTTHVTQRIEKLVVRVHNHLLDAWRCFTHDDIYIFPDLQAECV